ncbi:uncharacterized protein LOC133128978 [Conger conger]|uniref:uncharacterized protein LOC133128978 n=1 Tax=Conger conger TaxID=82655 RepID=UPI002A5AB1B5|nr:uncharacterized protein LOC133128978 [Conger conger]
MEESTYETFEDELGTPLQEKPPAKPVRLIHRADMQATRKVKEEPPSPQNAPKPALKEISRTMSIRRALSIQNLGQMESPWAGITLNRCLFVAVTILLISSGIQRLNEALKALRAEEDGKRVQEDGGRVEESLALRHAALKRDGTPPQPASSLWHSLFQWVLDDDDEDEEEESVTGMKSARGRGREKKQKKSALQEKQKRSEVTEVTEVTE